MCQAYELDVRWIERPISMIPVWATTFIEIQAAIDEKTPAPFLIL